VLSHIISGEKETKIKDQDKTNGHQKGLKGNQCELFKVLARVESVKIFISTQKLVDFNLRGRFAI
jgi:hypothetical protein